MTSFGFKSKPKEIEGKDGEGVQEETCDLSTEEQIQTISTFETITDVQWRLVVFFAGGQKLGVVENISRSHTQKMTLDSITS